MAAKTLLMARKFTAKMQDQALALADGKCGYCGGMLKPGQFEYDHRKPHALGGESSLENCVVTCRACHISKSQDDDLPPMRKADKQAKVKKQLPVAVGVSEVARRFGIK
jgi:5-methylcytosine-specific restriction endonuclease McrA